ncbi:MAG: hypothetical protein LC797_04175 [Chloroflexi bacterium]|nr:hypothetical protein [Chloroflexota bacterium]
MGAAVTTADRRNCLVIALLGLTLGALYFVAIDLSDPTFILGQQQHVISGEAGSPYRYRVLVPWLLEVGTHAFAFAGPQNVAFLWASAVYDCVGLVLQLLSLYVLVRQWFSPLQSLVGVAFTSGATLVTFGYFTYQPWSILEVAFFSLGFLLAARGRWGPVGVVVVLASLNRETGVFLPLALLLASLERPPALTVAALRSALGRREARLALAYVLLSVAFFAGLRLARGSAPPVDALGDVVARNLDRNNVIAAGMILLVFLGFGWVFALAGVGRGPLFVRRVARVVPWYLAAFAVWGWWREARILTTLYPIVIPLVLAYCYSGRRPD